MCYFLKITEENNYGQIFVGKYLERKKIIGFATDSKIIFIFAKQN